MLKKYLVAVSLTISLAAVSCNVLATTKKEPLLDKAVNPFNSPSLVDNKSAAVDATKQKQTFKPDNKDNKKQSQTSACASCGGGGF